MSEYTTAGDVVTEGTTTVQSPYIGSLLDGTNSTSEHGDQQ